MSFFTYIHVKQNGDRKKLSVIAVAVGKPGFDSNLSINVAVMGNNALCMKLSIYKSIVRFVNIDKFIVKSCQENFFLGHY